MAQLERFTANTLDHEERQMATVEQRYRQQIYDAEFEAQHDGEHRNIGEALMSLLAGHLRDHDGAAEGFARWRRAVDYLEDADHDIVGNIPGAADAALHRTQWPLVLNNLI